MLKGTRIPVEGSIKTRATAAEKTFQKELATEAR